MIQFAVKDRKSRDEIIAYVEKLRDTYEEVSGSCFGPVKAHYVSMITALDEVLHYAND